MEVQVIESTEREMRERKIYRMVATGLMLMGWSIGIAQLLGVRL
jgi:hypothetical protein